MCRPAKFPDVHFRCLVLATHYCSFTCFLIFNFAARRQCSFKILFFYSMAPQPLVGQGHIIEASLSHSVTQHSVGHLWTGDQPDGESGTWQHTTLTRDRHSCLPFEPATPTCLRTQTHALDSVTFGMSII